MKIRDRGRTSRRSFSSGGRVPGGAQRGASRADGLAMLKKAFENHNWRVDANCCAWSDARKTLRSFAGAADVVLGPHGAGLANALLARRGLVLVEIHGDFGAELDLFRKVADGRAGGYVSVRGASRVRAA